MKRQREDSVASNSSLGSLSAKTAKKKDSLKAEKKDEQSGSCTWSISGFTGLRPVSRTLCFSPDFNVFNELVEATYSQLCAAVPDYSKNVSMGMFIYYCGVALWYRLHGIRFAQGTDRCWTFPCMKLDFPNGFCLPKAFCKFLDTIGDFVEQEGVYWKLVFPLVNSDGHFGAMTSDSFYKYLAYPAPAILTATLQQEFDVITDKKKVYSEWKLASIDFENCPKNLVFTENVCGYYVAPNASAYQSGPDDVIADQLGVGLKEIDSLEDRDSQISRSLVKYIFTHNSKLCKDKTYPMRYYANTHKYGSNAQIGFVEFVGGEEQSDYSLALKEVEGYSPCLLPDSLSKLIPLFRLRAKRALVVESFPYNFPTLDDVPESWVETLNAQFEYGDAINRWNLGVYTTGAVDRKLAINDFVRSFSRGH